MRRSILAGLVVMLACLEGPVSARADTDRVRDCMSPEQAHDLLIQQKFVAPFRALGEAIRAGQGEAIGVELCRLNEAYVYDVTLLHHDGHVRHVLVNARTGALAGARPK